MSHATDWQDPARLSPQDEHLLELVRAGKVDAEIAVRLGISNPELKERIERLVAKMGVTGRSGLLLPVARSAPDAEATDPEPTEPVGRPQPRWHILVALAAGVGVGAGLMWVAGRGSDEADRGAAGASSPTVTTALAPSVSGPSISSIPISVRNGREVYNAGQVFFGAGAGSGIIDVETRGELVVVRFRASGTFRFENGVSSWQVAAAGLSPFRATLIGNVDGRSLHLAPGDTDTEFLWGAEDSMGIITRAHEASPTLLLWMDGVHTEVGLDGHLYVDVEPSAPSAVITFDTGEVLDVPGAQQLGKLAGSWTNCADDEVAACYVIARPTNRIGEDPFGFPTDGLLTCRTDGVLELQTGNFRLDFHRIAQSGGEYAGCDPFSTDPVGVYAGEPVRPFNHYRIRAFDLEGRPISIVVARDGTLYVGDIPLKYGCPCRSGS